MIGKIFSDGIKAMETVQEQAQQISDSQQNVPAQPTPNHAVQERTFAKSLRSETMFTSVLQAQKLSAALDKQTLVGSEPPVSVGTTAPAGNVNEVLGLNMSGPQVLDFQHQLNFWRIGQGLPEINASGVYTQQTADAVKQFQEANGLAKDGLAGPNTKSRLQLENDYKFQRMNSDVKQEIRGMMNDYQNNPAARENLLKLVGDREFSSFMKPQSQIFALALLKQNPADANHLSNTIDTTRDMSALESDPTYKSLPVASRHAIRDALFEHAKYPDGREGIARLATSSLFEKLTEAQQLEMFKSIRENPGEKTAPEFLHILHSESFEKMNTHMRDYLLSMANQNAGSTEVLGRLSEDVNDTNFLYADDKTKWMVLSSFLPPYVPE
jgi:hypothetical protein